MIEENNNCAINFQTVVFGFSYLSRVTIFGRSHLENNDTYHKLYLIKEPTLTFAR